MNNKILKHAGFLFFALTVLCISSFILYQSGTKEEDVFAVEDQISLGMKFLNEGEFEQAAEVMNRVIEAEPYLREAVLAAAEAYKGQGKYKLSAGYYEKALELNQMDAGIWDELEKILIFSGDINPLKEMYRKSVLLFPSRSSHLEKLIHLCVSEGDISFIRSLAEDLEGSPLQPAVKYGYQAYTLLQEGKVEEAEGLLFQPEVSAGIKKSNARLYFGESNSEGEPNGLGICFYSGSEKATDIYIGQWRNGRREGKGRAFSSSLLPVYQERNLIKTISSQIIFEGNFKDDLPNGDCRMTRSYENGEERSFSIIEAEFCFGYAEGQVILEQYQDSGISLKQEHKVKAGIPQLFQLDRSDVLEDVYEAVYSGEDLLAYSSTPCSCVFTWD